MRLCLVLIALLVPPLANATELREEVQRHFDAGRMNFGLQRYGEALEHFQAAYELSQDAVFLYNIGQCQRVLGQRDAALLSYRTYLSQQPDAPNRDQVERLIDQLKSAEPAPPPPARARPTAPPPEPAVRAEPARPIAALPAVVRTPPNRRRWYRRATPMAVTSLGAVLAVTGAVLLGVGAADDATARPLAAERQDWEEGGQLRTAGLATISAGGAVVLLGGILFGATR